MVLETSHLKVGGFTPCEALTGAAGEGTTGARSWEQQMVQLSHEAGRRDGRLKAPGKLHRDDVHHLVLENQKLTRLGKDLRGCVSQSSRGQRGLLRSHGQLVQSLGTGRPRAPHGSSFSHREQQTGRKILHAMKQAQPGDLRSPDLFT